MRPSLPPTWWAALLLAAYLEGCLLVLFVLGMLVSHSGTIFAVLAPVGFVLQYPGLQVASAVGDLVTKTFGYLESGTIGSGIFFGSVFVAQPGRVGMYSCPPHWSGNRGQEIPTRPTAMNWPNSTLHPTRARKVLWSFGPLSWARSGELGS